MSHNISTGAIRLTLLMSIALATLLPVAALAQEAPPSLDRLTIELWPEFDREGVLVIYNGELAADTVLPAEVSLLLPADAALNAVAYLDAGGNLLNAQYEEATVEDGTRINLTLADSGNFWVEFYTPAGSLTEDGDTRGFTHTWPGELAVGQLTWHVQQPATASDLAVEPAGGQVGTDSFGFRDYTVSGGALAAGQSASATVSYQKSDDVLSASQIESAQPPPEAPAAPSPPANRVAGLGGIWPIALALLGVLLLVVGVYVYWRSGRDVPSVAPSGPVTSSGRAKTTRAERSAQQRQSAAGYCTNCGNPLQPGDKFCRECGTPVAHESHS